MSGTYKLYLAQTMLALFSSKKFEFTIPEGRDEEEMDLTAHLTNTCLQVGESPDLQGHRQYAHHWYD
jgi:hypothetical protein